MTHNHNSTVAPKSAPTGHTSLALSTAALLLTTIIITLAPPTFSAPTPDPAQFPVNLAPNGPILSRRLPDGNDVLVCTKGIYVSKRLSPTEAQTIADAAPFDDILGPNPLIEIRAQNAVVFYSLQQLLTPAPDDSTQKGLPSPSVHSIYLQGDVVLQVGHNEITAREVFYNFQSNAGLIIDGALRIILPERNVPLYLRAEEIRQLDLNHFNARRVKFGTDEFYKPFFWLGAQSADVQMDTDPQTGRDSTKYRLENVTANVGDLPIFWWPHAAGAGTSTDAPLKRIHTSYDSQLGVSVETEWHPGWLLGVEEPPGVDSTLRIDEFTKRGPAVGFDLDYSQKQYFGKLRSYLIDDHGEDQLGDYDTRKDIEPPRQTRGRVRFQHRQYLTDDWLASFELGYHSDPEFLESWERKEFNNEKESETVLYFKHQRDNWAFDFLNKWHLNDFDYTVTELPTAGFHLVGHDLFRHLTYYQDSYVTHLRERAGDRDVSGFNAYEPSILPDALNQEAFAFGVSRHELALPLYLPGLNLVPTIIGVHSYDDSQPDHSVLHGAAGFRASTQLWHTDNNVRSRFWDLDRLRHVIVPEASLFVTDSDRRRYPNRNVFNLALRQRWQTMRGLPEQKHAVDWLRWDTSLTLVNHDTDDNPLPNNFLFSRPETHFDHAPLINPDLSNLGLTRRQQINQNFADHVNTNWTWLASDKTTFTGSAQCNLHDGVLTQADAAIAVQRSPRTSYYIGDRYLRRADTFRDNDAHFLTAAASYKLNRKYTFSAAQQYDIVQTEDSYSQLVVIRKFPHWYGAFSISYDADNNNLSFQVSFWPEGFDKVAVGSRRFTRLTR